MSQMSGQRSETSSRQRREKQNRSLHDTAIPHSGNDDPKFKAICDKINLDSIAVLASNVRQACQTKGTASPTDSSSESHIGCRVKASYQGSYNIAYPIDFDDGITWILKIPANGHSRAWNTTAAEALISEALTMRYVRAQTTVPLPMVHDFNASLNNVIGCPYILMDLARGRCLQHLWFAPETSVARQENVRARALQTIAVAMAQLSQLTFDRGGSLRFDDEGNVLELGPSKVIDVDARLDHEEDSPCAQKELDDQDDIFFEKESMADPLSSVLFLLDRRTCKITQSNFQRGLCQSLRLYSQWALDYMDGQQEKAFSLAHPDFDVQNIYVQDDGTLSDIIDWDGVAAVPMSVGSLRYPSFLLRDWDLTYYNWNLQADRQGDGDRIENSPDELIACRLMYAQFLETALSGIPSLAGKCVHLANITRSSIVTGCLELAASDQSMVPAVLENTFEELVRAETEVHTPGCLDEYVRLYGRVIKTLDSETESEISDADKQSDENSDGREETPGVMGADQIVENITNPALTNGGRSPCRQCFTIMEPQKSRNQSRPLDSNQAYVNEDPAPEMASAATPVATRMAKFAMLLAEKSCRNIAGAFYHNHTNASVATKANPFATDTPTNPKDSIDTGNSYPIKKTSATLGQSVEEKHLLDQASCSDQRLWHSLKKLLLLPLVRLVSLILKSVRPEAQPTGTAEARMGMKVQDQASEIEPTLRYSEDCAQVVKTGAAKIRTTMTVKDSATVRVIPAKEELSLKKRKENKPKEFVSQASKQPAMGPVEIEINDEPAALQTDSYEIRMDELDDSFTAQTPSRFGSAVQPVMQATYKTAESKSEVCSTYRQATGGTYQPMSELHDRFLSQSIASVASQATSAPIESTTTGESVVIIASHMTADGKPFPRNKPCPCGSRHKFKKCCGKVNTLQSQSLAVLKESRSAPNENGIRSTTSSSVAKSCNNSYGARSSNTSVASHGELVDRADTEEPAEGFECQHDESHAVPEIDPIEEKLEEEKQAEEGHVDNGGFTMNEICVALGKGNLDEERYERLKKAFETLLDWTMGKW